MSNLFDSIFDKPIEELTDEQRKRREEIIKRFFNKPLEEMTDEELRKEFSQADDGVGWVEDGWAMEPNPLDRDYTPSEDEVNDAYDRLNAVCAEQRRRGHSAKK